MISSAMAAIEVFAVSLLLLLFMDMSYSGSAADNGGGEGGGLGASFIFGDSLVDAGNNNYLNTLSKANFPPNGIDFKASGGRPTGRYTNGRTIGDIIGQELGQPKFIVPLLAPNATGRAILDGVNYASGGGGILNETGKIFVNRLGMDIQVDYFNITRREFDKLLGPSKARDYIIKRSIFSITIGSNDFLNSYLLPVISIGERLSESPDAFIKDMIKHLKLQLIRLYKLDARKFVVANVGPIGCIPYQRTIHRLKANECVESANNMASQYNTRLRDLLAELNEKLPGSKFVYANVYDLVMDLVRNYKQHGFSTASRACCKSRGLFAGIFPCGPHSRVCSNRSKYVFWDPYHPTEAANLVIADRLLDGDAKYISPINIRQLRDL